MRGRPITPPCVQFRTRRFNRISALARTVSGYCSIQHGRVFLLRDFPVPHIANMPFEFSPLSMPSLSALPALSSSLLWFCALFCRAYLPSLPALFAISVRQARVLPIERSFNFQNPAFFRFHLAVDTLAFD